MPDPAPDHRPSRDEALELERLLTLQLADVDSAIDGLHRDLDGMLHEARVAVRRLRVSLAFLRRELDPRTAKRLRADAVWLARVLGPTRDAQVLLARLGKAVAETCPDDPAAARLVRVFEQRYDEAATAAQQTLAGPRVDVLRRRLDRAGRGRLVAGTCAGQATRDARISADLDGLLTQLRGLLREPAAPVRDERLHELRKSVKRARYSRQVTAALRQEHFRDDVHAALSSLQSLLGEHHDSVVMRQQLSAAASGHADLAEVTDALVVREERAADYSEGRLEKLLLSWPTGVHRAEASWPPSTREGATPVAKKKKSGSAKQELKETVATLRSRLERAEAKAARWKDKAAGFRSSAATSQARTKKLEKLLTKAQQQSATPKKQTPKRTPPATPPPAAGPDSTWTVARLRAEARSRGLTGYSRKSKDQLLDDLN